MDTDIALPTIDESALAPRAATPQAAPTLNAIALAVLTGIKPALISLAARYKDVAFDLTTTAGLDGAKAARHDLRENGRFAVQRARDELKTTLNDTKTAVEATADDLIAIVKPQEEKLDTDIKAREVEISAEKAEKKRLAEERKARLEADLARIQSYVQSARDKSRTATWLAEVGIPFVDALTIDADVWGDDFTPRAKVALKAAQDGLRELHATVLAREQEAARVEAQRVENERVASELAAQQLKLAEQQAQIDAANAELQRRKDIDGHKDFLRGVIAGDFDSTPTATLLSSVNDAITGMMVLTDDKMTDEMVALGNGAISRWNTLDLAANPPAAAAAAATDLLDDPVGNPAPAPAAEPVKADEQAVATDAAAAPAATPESPRSRYYRSGPPAVAVTPAPAPAPATVSAPAPAPASEAPSITLGVLCAEVGPGFKMTEAFVETTLGVIAHKERGSVLYTTMQRHEVLSALRDHVDGLLAV